MRSFLVACSLSFNKTVAKVSSADRLSISSGSRILFSSGPSLIADKVTVDVVLFNF